MMASKEKCGIREHTRRGCYLECDEEAQWVNNGGGPRREYGERREYNQGGYNSYGKGDFSEMTKSFDPNHHSHSNLSWENNNIQPYTPPPYQNTPPQQPYYTPPQQPHYTPYQQPTSKLPPPKTNTSPLEAMFSSLVKNLGTFVESNEKIVGKLATSMEANAKIFEKLATAVEATQQTIEKRFRNVEQGMESLSDSMKRLERSFQNAEKERLLPHSEQAQGITTLQSGKTIDNGIKDSKQEEEGKVDKKEVEESIDEEKIEKVLPPKKKKGEST